jgi:hypothetical protein
MAVAALCLSHLSSVSANDPDIMAPLFSSPVLDDVNRPLVILPIQKQRSQNSLAFDLGGSETRKLGLQLSRPLTLDVNGHVMSTTSGLGSVFLDTTFSLNLNDRVDITSSLGAGKSQASFQPLGSIHCQNGVLEQGSYRASDCHFINQTNILQQDQVALGLRYSDDNINSAVSIFRHEASVGQKGVVNYAAPLNNPIMSPGLLAPDRGNPLLPLIGSGQELTYLNGETTGLDMEFQLGLTTDSAGDIRLGLQLTRVLEASYDTSLAFAPSLQNWTIENPFDTAKVNFDWSKGSFSGGIQGYYREPIQFLNGEELDSSTSFDVHFTWRAPWNANLSVGTSNVLGSGTESKGKTDSGLRDPFEGVYGRIPYVRYQQDL